MVTAIHFLFLTSLVAPLAFANQTTTLQTIGGGPTKLNLENDVGANATDFGSDRANNGELANPSFFPLFPLRGAVFLPDDAKIAEVTGKNETPERHLATIESVLPIIDVAIRDAHRYLSRWTTSPNWLQIHTSPILQCHDQGKAAWAALEAVHWTNGSGLDVAFGPSCDYPLATVTRILSFYRVPIFTNAGFSEFFIEQKSTALITRIGPLQDHVSQLLEILFREFGWKRSRMFYEKQFWSSELHEAGFCKLLMNGLYARTVTKRWDLDLYPAIISSRAQAKHDLLESVGSAYGEWSDRSDLANLWWLLLVDWGFSTKVLVATDCGSLQLTIPEYFGFGRAHAQLELEGDIITIACCSKGTAEAQQCAPVGPTGQQRTPRARRPMTGTARMPPNGVHHQTPKGRQPPNESPPHSFTSPTRTQLSWRQQPHSPTSPPIALLLLLLTLILCVATIPATSTKATTTIVLSSAEPTATMRQAASRSLFDRTDEEEDTDEGNNGDDSEIDAMMDDGEEMRWLKRKRRKGGATAGRKKSSNWLDDLSGEEQRLPAEAPSVQRIARTVTAHGHHQNGDILREREQRRPHTAATKLFDISPDHPIHILFPLPTDEGRKNENPFGITILKAQPVVDEAVEEVYRRELVAPNSLAIHFEDSRLSDAHGPNVAINQLVDNRLDCIIGYAFVYALAPVARMSPFWRDNDSNGIPVITSVGLTSNLDNRREYQLMTRISSPYKVVKNAVVAFFEGMRWFKSAYLFHEQRHDAANPSIPYGECYLLMASVQPHLYQRNKMEHNYFMFNELNYNHRERERVLHMKERMRENLKKASMLSNESRTHTFLLLRRQSLWSAQFAPRGHTATSTAFFIHSLIPQQTHTHPINLQLAECNTNNNSNVVMDQQRPPRRRRRWRDGAVGLTSAGRTAVTNAQDKPAGNNPILVTRPIGAPQSAVATGNSVVACSALWEHHPSCSSSTAYLHLPTPASPPNGPIQQTPDVPSFLPIEVDQTPQERLPKRTVRERRRRKSERWRQLSPTQRVSTHWAIKRAHFGGHFSSLLVVLLSLIVGVTALSSTTSNSVHDASESVLNAQRIQRSPVASEPYKSLARDFYRQRSAQSVSSASGGGPRGLPFNVILILPERESDNDKFGLTVAKVRPVIDIAIEDLVRHGTMPRGWINITYHDSRYWEDTLLAERVSATGVVQAYCERRLDAIFGFADAYSLATVSKISAGFGEGVPVLTTTGLTTIIGSKKSYPYVTRMRGSYTQMAEAAYKFIAQHDVDDGLPHARINMHYANVVFMYHDKRRALNKPPSGGRRGDGSGGAAPEESPSSSCYFSLHAIKSYFQDHNEQFLDAWKSQTPHVAFDEELARSRQEVSDWVKLASMQANDNLLRNPYRLSIPKAQPVFDVAIGDITEKFQILPPGAFRLAYEDTELSDAIGPQKIVNHYCNRSVDAVMGMAYVFALAPVARMSQFWGVGGVPVFTTTAMVDELGDRSAFPLLTRLMGTYRTLGRMAHRLFAELGFRRFHFFFNDQAVHGSSQGRSECFFSLNAIKNLYDRRNWTVEMFSEKTTNRSIFRDLLKKSSMLSNIIILCASPDTVREIMLAAYELGMAQSGEYVFINIDVSTGSHAERPWLRQNDTYTSVEENEKAKRAYRALKTISLRRSDLDEYKNFEARVKERAEKKYSYSLKTGKEYEMNNFISAFYDAVLLYAIALNETLAEGLDPRNGRNITSKMWNRTFVGITGNVSIDHNGDRYSDYSLLDLDPVQDKFVEVAYYSGASNELKQMTDFHWVGNKPPSDSPVCGWDHSKCPEGYPAHTYVLMGLVIVVFILLIGFIIFYRRYRAEAELAKMTWKIKWEELDGEEVRREKKKKRQQNNSSGAKTRIDAVEQSEALLRSNSRISVGSDKRSSSSGATRKISAIIDRKFSIFTRKKSSPSDHLKCQSAAAGENHVGGGYEEGNSPHPPSRANNNATMSSPSYSLSNSNKKKSSAEEELDLSNCGKKSLASVGTKNRKFSFSGYSIKSGGSVETIQMQNNAQIFTKTAMYKGTMVAIKFLNLDQKKYPKLDLPRSLLVQLKEMKDLQHDHITRFCGACVDAPNYCIVTEYCPKGSLEDILENEKIKLDKMMKYSLLHDLVKGMHYLHGSLIRTHGRLKSSNCVVDSRFVLKVTDYGLAELHAMEETQEEIEVHAFWRKKIWTAPELLRDQKAPIQGTQKGDVYSFAIILHEMLYRKGAFYRGEDENPSPQEVIERLTVVPQTEADLYRPVIPDFSPVDDTPDTVKKLIELMMASWSENPHARPDFSTIRKVVHTLNKENETSNLVDNLLKRMEQYATNLEGLVEERTQEYLGEKKKVEDLLHQLLPPSIADQLISGNPVQAESYECVTIYFSDIVGFTALSSLSTPMQVVTLLNDLYMAFDNVVDNFQVYKVETIGDAYMVVSGLPERTTDHASQIAQMSLALLHKVKNFTIRHRPNEQLKLRIGMHSGSVVAGVVGSKMPRYCLFGDTVNTSSRMESNGLPLRIHVSSATKEILCQDADFNLELRGEVEMKGKGKQTTYWLKGYKDIQIPYFGPEYL